MDRLFGLLLISLSILTGAILSQNLYLILIVFVIGIVLFFFGGKKQRNEAKVEYTNEEIEKELEEINKISGA